MRALSLTQPRASLMAFDEKRIETRDWSTSVRGDVAIVASKGFPRAARELCHREPFITVLRDHGITIVGLTPSKPNQLPLSVVVCVVELFACHPTAELAGRIAMAAGGAPPAPALHELDFGNYDPIDRDTGRPRFGLLTRNLRVLQRPVPVERLEGGVAKPGGALGFYQLSPACEAAVLEQLRLIDSAPKEG